jgi:Peptidase family S49
LRQNDSPLSVLNIAALILLSNYSENPSSREETMLLKGIRNRPWTVLGGTSLLAAVGYRYRCRQDEARRLEDSKRKKILVLPFYRMAIVEERSPLSLSSLAGRTPPASGPGGRGGDRTVEMTADELVGLIHEAAHDPSIVGLYGIFGNGGGFSTGGWAHLQEIRNALQVFATSHRQHLEPGVETPPQRDRKAMYAYSNTFANPLGSTPSMKEFFLASAFTTIHLQPQGDLNLLGLHATNAFFRDLLQKYGIEVHVWKHGPYKNMANRFTHSHFTREHYENVAGVLLPIHQHVCDSIYTSRHKYLKKFPDQGNFWEMVHSAGSLPARVALQIGFVDFLPRMDPLDVLIKNNQNGKGGIDEAGDTAPSAGGAEEGSATTNDRDGASSSEEDDVKVLPAEPTKEPLSLAEKWKFETDLDHFKADSKIDIAAYARQKAVERQREAKAWKLFQSLQGMSESNVAMRQVLSLLGYRAPYFNIPPVSSYKLKGSVALVDPFTFSTLRFPVKKGKVLDRKSLGSQRKDCRYQNQRNDWRSGSSQGGKGFAKDQGTKGRQMCGAQGGFTGRKYQCL